MKPSPGEIPLDQFVAMNILLWNCRGALNPDFKRRIFEMAINHKPAIMVITETRVGGDRAERIIADLPFDGFITTDTIGYAGGLWVLWNKEEAVVTRVAVTEQEIHATVKVCHSNLNWFISAIYASPRLAERRLVWSNLIEIAKLHNYPWLMLGDFNEVLSGEEKFGGNPINLNRALEFKECLDNCNFLDLGFAGPKYTWTNKRPVSSLILERIDRCFGNPSWRMLYPEATVTHLPRTFSDHCPVLIDLLGSKSESNNRPFRFHTMWLLHPQFPKVVEEAWAGERTLLPAISDFTVKVKKWNIAVFGNLFNRKRRVLARLGGAQKAIACHPSDDLLRLEKTLIEEHASIMLQEEEFWALKSRLNAATFGDRNTSFFHITTVVRRQKNKIRCLMDGNGEWIYDENKVKEHIQYEFTKLYTSGLSVAYLFSPVSNFSCCKLSDVEMMRVGREVSDEEIREALWSLKAFNAPGPDGLHAGFFQYFWNEVQASICQEVKKAFVSESIPAFLNTTLVTLIPKCNNPESLANFRPISLCNSVYKVISKVLVSRIRPLLNKLMSPVQSAFIPGRRGVDNVIIAQELLYTMDRMKGRDGYIAVKVDLEKAYDRLEWSFVYNVLQAFHFPVNIINLIMSCISNTSLSVLVNGSTLESINLQGA